MNNLNRPTALSLGAIALIVGAIGPWISVFGGLINGGPMNDTETALIVFGGIALVIGSALTRFQMRILSVLVGFGVMAEVGYTWSKINEANSSAFGSIVNPGWGLYLTAVAGLYLVASTWVAQKAS
jgi:hypothetical protein